MYCDYQALNDYAIKLTKTFNQMSRIMQELEENNKTIYNENNWSGETREYYVKKFKILQENFDVLTNHFLNIARYLDNVVENYAATEERMSNLFGG